MLVNNSLVNKGLVFVSKSHGLVGTLAGLHHNGHERETFAARSGDLGGCLATVLEGGHILLLGSARLLVVILVRAFQIFVGDC